MCRLWIRRSTPTPNRTKFCLCPEIFRENIYLKKELRLASRSQWKWSRLTPISRRPRGSLLDAREGVDGSDSSAATRADHVPCVCLKRPLPSRSFQESQSKKDKTETKTLQIQIRVVEPEKQLPSERQKPGTRESQLKDGGLRRQRRQAILEPGLAAAQGRGLALRVAAAASSSSCGGAGRCLCYYYWCGCCR